METIDQPVQNEAPTKVNPFAGMARRFFTPRAIEILTWFAVLNGVVFRVYEWGRGRSLWGDEAMLALNLLNRDFMGLFAPLEHDQSAPVGFLLLMKAAISTFGNNEWALRLVPMLSAVCSLLLFPKLCRFVLNPVERLIAVALFAIMGSLIFYGGEVKQYSSDVLLAIVLLTMFLQFEQKGWTIARAGLMGVVGAVAIWFSHAVVFVLAGLGVVQTISLVRKQAYASLKLMILPAVLWVLSFSVFYLVALRPMTGNEELIEFWTEEFGFMPRSGLLPWWLIKRTMDMFDRSPLLTGPLPFAAALWILGLSCWWRENRRMFWLLVSPMLIALVASALEKYPFHSRLILFLAPSIILTMAKSLSLIRQFTIRDLRYAGLASFGIVFCTSFYGAQHPDMIFLKPAVGEMVKYISQSGKEGDFIYPHFNGLLLRYYIERNEWKSWPEKPSLENGQVMSRAREKRDLVKEFGKLIERIPADQPKVRVWVITGSHLEKYNEEAKERIERFDKLGTRLNRQKGDGTRLFLFEIETERIRKYVEQKQQEYLEEG